MTCYFGDCREVMKRLISDGVKVQMCCTSPPYWGLRDYGVPGQLGLESTPEEYVSNMVEVFSLVRELLADDGTLWLNLGDSYAASPKGSLNGQDKSSLTSTRTQEHSPTGINKLAIGLKPKDLVGIPWRVAFALQADGWYLRQWMPWVKRNAMPESVTDRPASACEVVFLLSKSEKYFYDHEAVKLPASMALMKDSRWVTGSTDRNEKTGYAESKAQNPKQLHRMFDKQRGHSRKHAGFNERWDAMEKQEQCGGWRSTRNTDWFFEGMLTDDDGNPLAFVVSPAAYAGAHFATFPPALIEPCILAGSRPSDIVLDPFLGSGTTGEVAQELGRKWVGIELNRAYEPLQRNRTAQQGMVLA